MCPCRAFCECFFYILFSSEILIFAYFWIFGFKEITHFQRIKQKTKKPIRKMETDLDGSMLGTKNGTVTWSKCLEIRIWDRWQWKRDVSIKSWNFEDTRQTISVPLAMSTNLQKKRFKLSETPPPKQSWADLGPKSAGEELSHMFVRSGEISSSGQASIDKNNDSAMKSKPGTLVRGSNPSSGHSVEKRPVMGGGSRPGVW